jgi:hypothetical protein
VALVTEAAAGRDDEVRRNLPVDHVGHRDHGLEDRAGWRRRLGGVHQGRVAGGILGLLQGGFVEGRAVQVVVHRRQARHRQHLAGLRVERHRTGEVAARLRQRRAEGVGQVSLQPQVESQAEVEAGYGRAIPVERHRPSLGIDEEALLTGHAPQDGVVAALEA